MSVVSLGSFNSFILSSHYLSFLLIIFIVVISVLYHIHKDVRLNVKYRKWSVVVTGYWLIILRFFSI